MTFGLSAATVAGLTVATVGVGMSAASAAGAFGSSVDQSGPSVAEQQAGKYARQAYTLGRKIQTPLDALAREDLRYLGSNRALATAGDAGVNQFWGQAGDLQQNLAPLATASGGPGSGRWMGQLGQGVGLLDAGLRQSAVQGRLGGLNQYLARQGQFLGRRTNDLNTGLSTMTTGGAMAAQNQMATRQAQIQSNIAANQAMGQIGGTLTSVGMAGVGMAGGGAGAGGFAGPYGPSK